MVSLIEPVPIEDDLCTELALIEDLGYGARIVLSHTQTCYETGESVRVVKRKIVLPLSAVGPGVQMMLRFLAGQAANGAGEGLLRLVT